LTPYVLSALFVALVGIAICAQITKRFENTLYPALVALYALLVAMSGGIHALALCLVPADAITNAAGQQADTSLSRTLAYLCLYLFFPVILIVQKHMISVIRLSACIRWLSLAALITSVTALFQTYGDHNFLHSPWWMWWGRYEGLSSDPNGLAMTIFLVIPLLLIGVGTEKNIAVRLVYLCACLILASAAWQTGNRTSNAGILMMFVFLPGAFAIAWREGLLWKRLALGTSPLIMMVFLALSFQHMEGMGNTGSRLLQTWDTLTEEGVVAVFTKQEGRGYYFSLAKELIGISPVSGWGPAGFYRESSNIQYVLDPESRNKLLDSALNHYLMIAVDFGLIVTIINLSIILLPLYIGIRLMFCVKDFTQRYIVVLLGFAQCIFLGMINTVPPAYFLDVLWVWSIHLALLLVIGERNGVMLRVPKTLRKKLGLATAVFVLFVSVAAASYQVSFADTYGYAARIEHPWWIR